MFTACSELCKALLLVLSVTFFVCESNISGTAEQICAKFIGETCLVPRSYEFECPGQRSRSPGTKTAFFGPFGGLRVVYVICLVKHL